MAELKRDIGLPSAIAYVLGVIIGAGIYVLIGKAAGITGNSLWLSFLIAAFIAACTGLSYAELAAAFPYDAAEYLYTERAFKDRRFSFAIGWMKLATTVIGASAVALGFGGYLAWLTGWNLIVCSLLLVAVLTLVNLIGVKQALWFDLFMVFLAVLGLVIVIVAGTPSLLSKAGSFYMEMPGGTSGVFTAAALIFFAFLGFENVGNIAEEIRNPKRNLPLALIISVIVSVILYVLVALVAISVVPWDVLAKSASPLSDVMTALVGSKAGIMMAIMALGATGSTVIGLMIATSRMLYGLAEEGSFPKFFLKLTKNKMPYVAILVTSLICIIFILPGDITSVAFLVDFGSLLIFLVVNLCVISLRYSHDHIPRGFKVPLNIGKFPVIPALGMVSSGVLLFSFSKKTFVFGILFFLLGLALYSVFVRKKKEQVMKGKKMTTRAKKKKSNKRLK